MQQRNIESKYIYWEKSLFFLEFDLQMTSKSYTVTFSVRQTGVF